nr:hypothetical protein [uncultured Sphingosinicella sp.]
MTLSPFLKRVLLLDAASCLGMGLLLTLGGDPLAALFGIDAKIVGGAGLALFPVGLFMLWLGTRNAAPAAFVYLVIAGNALWTLESFVVAANAQDITGLGTGFVTVQALAVAGLAALEWVGLRRSRAAAA